MGIYDWYQDIQNRTDPRTSDWFMVTGPGPLLMIIISYIYFCTSAGPRYMRDKKPYTLRKTLIVYNFVQVVMSTIMVHEAMQGGWLNGYKFVCEPVDYSMDPNSLRMARAVWMYYVCKLVELLDTVFFVLRKKDRQISFLHVYHHALMPLGAWIGVRFYPGGHVTLLGTLNSFVHIIMYGYYMLSAMGPEIQKYLWWKKYLTLLQLAQFAIVSVQNLQLLITDCNFPIIWAIFLNFNALFFFYLFGSFYIQTYVNTRTENATKKQNGVTAGSGARSNAVKSD